MPGGAGGPCAALARSKPVRVVYGPGTFINSSVEEITKQLQAQTRARAAQADRANEAARKLALADGRSAAEAKRLGKQAEQLVYAQFAKELLALNAKYGLNLTGAPKVNDPDFVYQLVFDPERGRAGAEGAVRVPVPVGGLGADLGAAEGGAERCAARAGGRADPVRGGDERVRARRRRQLRRHRRAGARGRDHGRPGGVDACGCCWSRWR